MWIRHFGLASLLLTALVWPTLAAEPPKDKKPTPPPAKKPNPPADQHPPMPHHPPQQHPQPQHPQNHHPQTVNWPWYYPQMQRPGWYPSYYPYLPAMAYPIAGLLPGYAPAKPMPAEPTSEQRELVLNVAGTVTVTALQPTRVYRASTFDAVQPEQTVTLLVKSTDDKLAAISVRVSAKVVAVDKDSDPRQITVLAKIDAGTAKLDVDKVQVVAVTVTSSPAVAKK